MKNRKEYQGGKETLGNQEKEEMNGGGEKEKGGNEKVSKGERRC